MPQSPDLSMAGREPPNMGPLTHGFSALGDAAHRAAGTISALAADAAQAPHRRGHAGHLLTANGQAGTPRQVVLPKVRKLIKKIGVEMLEDPGLPISSTYR